MNLISKWKFGKKSGKFIEYVELSKKSMKVISKVL